MKTLLIIILFLVALPARATTYYVSSSLGNDANTSTQAQSKSTPWHNLPGMKNWTGTYTPVAGDSFILYGCDSWLNASFPITWTWSGTSGSHITVGVDNTWYNTSVCPSSWNRPIFNMQATMINGTTCTSQIHFVYIFTSADYVDFNWQEVTGYYWSNLAQGGCYGYGGMILSSGSDFITVNNGYYHNWTHAASGTSDNDQMIYVNNGCTHCYFNQNVVDNVDGDGSSCATSSATCSGFGDRGWNFTKNICANVSNCFLSNTLSTATIEIGNNNFFNINESYNGNHPNVIETTGVVSGTGVYYIHDNYTHNIVVAESLQVGNNNETDYVWNNIIVVNPSSVGSNGPHLPQSGTPTAMYFFNNTVAGWSACFTSSGNGTYTWTSTLLIENNHCIPNSGSGTVSGSPTGGTTSISNNVGMTTSTATSQGYTNSQTYVYSPTLNTNGTVGAGANLTSTVPGAFTTNDTNYACSEQTVSGVVESVCPTRVSNTRPASGAWDAGAYEFTGAPPPVNTQLSIFITLRTSPTVFVP